MQKVLGSFPGSSLSSYFVSFYLLSFSSFHIHLMYMLMFKAIARTRNGLKKSFPFLPTFTAQCQSTTAYKLLQSSELCRIIFTVIFTKSITLRLEFTHQCVHHPVPKINHFPTTLRHPHAHSRRRMGKDPSHDRHHLT